MKNPNALLFALILFFACHVAMASEKQFSLYSPDKRTDVKITLGDKIEYSMLHNGKILIAPSPISIEFINGTIIGSKPTLIKQKSLTVNGEVKPLYGQNAIIK